jgi:NAD(P)-dependent dehydrogenase (short-subunit alcohol dehydrogenase family)
MASTTWVTSRACSRDGFAALLRVLTQAPYSFRFRRLTNALLPALRDAGGDVRIVHVSSIAAYGAGFDVSDLDWSARQYEKWSAYCASKRENVLFSDALAEREAAAGSSVSSVSLHPGVVDTELVRYLVPPDWLAARATADQSRSQLATALTHLLGVRSPPEGAAPSLWAATAPRDAFVSGGYYLDAAQLAPSLGRPGGGAGGKALRDELWERSAAAVADAAAGRVRVAMAA